MSDEFAAAADLLAMHLGATPVRPRPASHPVVLRDLLPQMHRCLLFEEPGGDQHPWVLPWIVRTCTTLQTRTGWTDDERRELADIKSEAALRWASDRRNPEGASA